jgi:hypothetical protein
VSVVAVAEGVTSAEVLAAVARAVGGREWPAEAFETGWGAVAVAGAPTARVGDWLVAGAPVLDPWGVPAPAGGNDVGPVAAAFDRYGPAAVQLAAGPFLAVDLAYGRVVVAINGIVPVHVSTLGRWVASTSAQVVDALGKGGPEGYETAAPGTSVSPAGEGATWGPITPDPGVATVPWAWVDRSVGERVAGLGVLAPFPGEPDLWCAAHDQAIYLPRLKSSPRGPDPLARYADLRREALPRLWWKARQTGRWLYAPAFERPVVDAVALLRSGPPPREGTRR